MLTVDKLSLSQDLTEVWEQISTVLRAEVSADTFERWFSAVEILALDEKQLTLSAPNHIHQLWIESNYLGMLRSAIMLSLGVLPEIHFVFHDENTPGKPKAKSAAATAITQAVTPVEESERPEAPSNNGGINHRNTFDAFVVGPNNEFAHAACVSVGQAPAKTYNPLFIYGGVGLGKTHLMHAIGQEIRGRKKGAKVVYITSEDFTNQFIDAIQNHALTGFRKRYRHADILLIDDIQFLAEKGRTQEEFFHTFNTLFDGHKQIVLSSDRPPSEIPSLETRLVSRFEWGLTAELLPPDEETRVAILRKKAQHLTVKVSSEILRFLSQRVRSNVRRLEGALVRVASFISLTGDSAPCLEKVEHLLKDFLHEEARRTITIEQIQKRVAEHFDVRLADMTSKRRPKNIAFPRQIAMYLARELTTTSLSEIGEAFGGRDHGTVLHAHRLVRGKIQTDDKIKQVVSFLDTQLSR